MVDEQGRVKSESLVRYLEKLLFWLEVHIYNRISKRVNWILDRMKDDTLEITKEGNPINTDGNWRFKIDGDDLILQKRIGGTWTTAERTHGS